MRHDWPEDRVATFIVWLLSWTFGLLYPIMARWVACGSGNFAGESRDRRHRPSHRARTYTGSTKGCVPSDVTITLTECIAQVNESDRTMQRAEGVVLPNLYYFAAWTDSGCLLGCEHHHQTVISAANCISEAGGYVIAVEKGRLRALNDVEEKLFRVALYGAKASRLVVFKPGTAFKPSLN
jgi:hypothetical protein